MVDWNSELVLQRNAVSWQKFNHALFGIFVWEWVVSFDFDFSVLTGKRKFQWPMVFYFWGRYGYLGGMLCILILMDSSSALNCGLGFVFTGVLGNTALSIASLNLCIRTMAVWNLNKRVVIPLVMCSLAHFGIALSSILVVKGSWVEGTGCVTTHVHSNSYVILFGYTMVFDFVILLLTAYKLWPVRRLSAKSGHQGGDLAKVVFKDGLGYFVVAFLVNVIAMVFSLLHLNPILAVIADVPATTFATIVAGRVVRRVCTYRDKEGDHFTESRLSNFSRTAIYTSDAGMRTETNG